MRRLWSYLARYRARYVAGCLCLLVTASLAMAIPVLLKRAVDSIPTGARRRRRPTSRRGSAPRACTRSR